MPTLTVHLREGFFHVPVVVLVNGQERFRSDSVTTRMQIGLAKMVPLEVEAGKVEVEIMLPSLRQSVRDNVSVSANAHLGVDLDDKGHPSLRAG